MQILISTVILACIAVANILIRKSLVARTKLNIQLQSELSLEQQIEKFAREYDDINEAHPMAIDHWHEVKNQWFDHPVNKTTWYSGLGIFWDTVHEMIRCVPKEIALTSSLTYVREYRRYYEFQQWLRKKKN